MKRRVIAMFLMMSMVCTGLVSCLPFGGDGSGETTVPDSADETTEAPTTEAVATEEPTTETPTQETPTTEEPTVDTM